MKNNMSPMDRFLRIGISAICFYLALYYPPIASDTVVSYLLIAIGVINALVSLVGVCPVYMMVGISTNKSGSDDH